MSRAKWGKAKLNVLALKSEIECLYSENLNLEEIYQRLSADGKLSIGKRTFKRHASDLIKDTRTLTLKRLLNDKIITTDEFNTRIESRLGGSPSPSSQPPKNSIPVVPSQPPAVEPSSDPQPKTQRPKKTEASSTKKTSAFAHDPSATDKEMW